MSSIEIAAGHKNEFMVEYFNFQEIFMKHLKCLLNSWYIFNLLTVLNSENSIILNSCQLSTELCDLCFNCRHYISMKLTYNFFVFSIYNNYRKLNYFIKFDFSSIVFKNRQKGFTIGWFNQFLIKSTLNSILINTDQKLYKFWHLI